MNVFYFEIQTQSIATTKVAIFAETAGRASTISGRLMHNINLYDPSHSGAGLSLFEQSGKPQQMLDVLDVATNEGLGGYTLEGGWTILDVRHSG